MSDLLLAGVGGIGLPCVIERLPVDVLCVLWEMFANPAGQLYLLK